MADHFLYIQISERTKVVIRLDPGGAEGAILIFDTYEYDFYRSFLHLDNDNIQMKFMSVIFP